MEWNHDFSTLGSCAYNMKVSLHLCVHAKLFSGMSDFITLWDLAHQGSSVHGITQQVFWTPGIKLRHCSSCTAHSYNAETPRSSSFYQGSRVPSYKLQSGDDILGINASYFVSFYPSTNILVSSSPLNHQLLTCHK